jgi:hypothetical protein
MIILSPLLLILLTASLLWVVRKRPVRIQWGLSAAMALLIWLATLAIRLGPNSAIQLSVWQPSQMFQSPLGLSLDAITWPITYAVVTVLVAMVFTSASRGSEPSAGARIFWFLYTGSAILSILADNFLTVIITWTFFDFITAIFLFSVLRVDTEIRQVLTRLSIDISGILLVLAGTAFSITFGESARLGEPLGSPLGVSLIALGSFVRLGLLPLHFNLPGLMVIRRGLGTLLRLYPPAIVLAFLAKLFRAGIPDQSLPWFLVAGISGLVIGGLRWVLESDSVAGRPFFILGMSGIGIFSVASATDTYMGLVAAAITLLLAGAVLSLAEVFTPSHRALALGASLIQLGIPIMPVAILINTAGILVKENLPETLAAIGIILGISFTTLGSLHTFYAREIPWRTGESLVRLTFGLGLSLPLLTSIGIGIHLRPEVDLWSWLLLGVQVLLVVGGFVLLRNLSERNVVRVRINLSRIDPTAIYPAIAGGLQLFLAGMRSIADLIEGEAAILWIIAITVFLVLATG